MGDAHHLIRSRRGAADAQDAIAFVEQPDCDRVENFIEGIIADSLRSGSMNEREGQPLTHDGHMTRPKDRQCK